MSTEIPLGPFDLVRPDARGGMAEVWLARHREQGVPVAIKVLAPHTATAEFEKRFADEVRAVAALHHPAVIMVLDHGRIPREVADRHPGLTLGSPWLAMEYASGGTLAQIRSPLPWSMLQRVIFALLDALAHAHAHGVVHRDLKPANVLVATSDDARPGIKLSDFGIAWAGRPSLEEVDDGKIVGTPSYMAPEQIRGHWRDFGPWTDLYALGCLVWWLCTGRPPFHAAGRNMNSVMVAHLAHPLPAFSPRVPVPVGFDAWLGRLLAKPMEQRYQFAADAAAVLASLGPPIDGGPEQPWELDPAFQQTLTSTDLDLGAPWTALEETSHSMERPSGSLRGRPVAPLTRDWRRPMPKDPPMQLVGAGLSLYGLRTVPLAGREEQCDVLWSALHDVAASGRARLVLIHGPAGTGKSRLVEWLCRRGHELGALTWCKATFSPSKAPGAALRQMANDYVRTSGLPRADVARRVDDFLRRNGSVDRAEAEVLVELLCPAGPDDDPPTVRLTRPREYYLGTANTFHRVSQDRPLLAWFEDVQWGLHGLGLALEVLRTQVQRPFPCLMVLTMRNEALEEDSHEAERLQRLLDTPGVLSLDLGPLSTTAHRQLVRGLLGLDDVLAARVEERTRGNPLFAVQLVGSWVADGTLEVSPRGFRLKAQANVELPDDLHSVWAVQVDRVVSEFPEQAQRYLELAACLGMEVRRDEWGQAADDPEGHFGGRFKGDDALRDALVDRLLDRRLVVGTRQQWSFVHGMLRESLQRTAQEAGRWRGHHESCAAMLRCAVDPGPSSERLGRHLLDAGHPLEALEPLLRGVDHRLVTVGPQPAQLLVAIVGRAMAHVALSVSDPRWGQLWTLKARIHADLGDLDRALIEARRARTASEHQGWGDVGRGALYAEATLLLRQGHPAEAQTLFERLAVEARASDDDGRRGAALAGLAQVAWRRGDLARCAELQDQALDVFGLAPSPAWAVTQADTLVQRGRCAEALGEAAEADAIYRVALARYEVLGSGLGAAECLDRLGRLAALEGDHPRAEALLAQGLSRYEALGGDRAVPCRMRLAQAILRTDARRAWPVVAGIQPLLAPLDHVGRVAASVGLQLVKAAIDADWEEMDEALADAAAKLPDLARSNDPIAPFVVAWMVQIAGETALLAGQVQRARFALGGAGMLWRAMGHVSQAAEVEALLASG